MTNICKNCLFYRPFSGNVAEENVELGGQCRIRAPISAISYAVGMVEMHPRAYWPVVLDVDDCGEFKEIPAPPKTAEILTGTWPRDPASIIPPPAPFPAEGEPAFRIGMETETGMSYLHDGRASGGALCWMGLSTATRLSEKTAHAWMILMSDNRRSWHIPDSAVISFERIEDAPMSEKVKQVVSRLDPSGRRSYWNGYSDAHKTNLYWEPYKEDVSEEYIFSNVEEDPNFLTSVAHADLSGRDCTYSWERL